MDIENKDRNLYQELYGAQADTKAHIGKAGSIGKNLEQELKDIQAHTTTATKVIEGIGITKNIMDAQKRQAEEVEKVDKYALGQTYEAEEELEGGDQYADKDGNWVSTQKSTKKKYKRYQDPKADWWEDSTVVKYKDQESGEILSVGDMYADMTEQKRLKKLGLDKPMEKQKSLYDEGEIKQYFSDMGKWQDKVGSAKMNPHEVTSKFGDTYKLSKESSLFGATMGGWDFSKMLQDWDSKFGETSVIKEVLDSGSYGVDTSGDKKDEKKYDPTWTF